MQHLILLITFNDSHPSAPALLCCAGKSSMLQAILQTMRLTKGEMHVGGTVSYVPQTPW